MLSTLAYLAGLLATLVVGIVIGVWFAELLELEDSLRESAGGLIRQQQLPLSVSQAAEIADRLADAWQADTDQWEQVANALDFPMTDYTPRRDAC